MIVLLTDNIADRSVNINDYFTYSLYCNVCRSLFEKHKLLFAVLLAARILQSKGAINMVSCTISESYCTFLVGLPVTSILDAQWGPSIGAIASHKTY